MCLEDGGYVFLGQNAMVNQQEDVHPQGDGNILRDDFPQVIDNSSDSNTSDPQP